MCPQAQTLHWEIHKILFPSGKNGILKSVSVKNEYWWHLLDDCFLKAFSFLAALWAFISNEGVFIAVMQQSFQRAVSTYRKHKGQDSERLKRGRFMLTVPTRNHMSMHALEKYGYDRGFAVRPCCCHVMRCKTTPKAGPWGLHAARQAIALKTHGNHSVHCQRTGGETHQPYSSVLTGKQGSFY